MALASTIDDTLRTARAWLDGQLAQAERLRAMIAVAAAVTFVGLLIVAIGATGDQVRSLRAAQTDLARLKLQLKDGSWADRKRQSETLKFQLAERFWTAETAGLAEAGFERWLRERTEGRGVRPDSIRVQRAALSGDADRNGASPLAGVQRMTAKVIMPFDPAALYDVLNAAAADPKILVVDRLLVRAGRNALIEMDISTFVKLPETSR
jgi:hypothetical protein